MSNFNGNGSLLLNYISYYEGVWLVYDNHRYLQHRHEYIILVDVGNNNPGGYFFDKRTVFVKLLRLTNHAKS